MIIWFKCHCCDYFAVAIADDQVCYLINLGIPGIAITKDEDSGIILQVLNGDYIVVFGSQVRVFVVYHCVEGYLLVSKLLRLKPYWSSKSRSILSPV